MKNQPRKPSQVRQMTPIEAAWVGAMIEGEGCISISRSHSDTYDNYHLIVGNNSLEVISAMLRATGTGNVYLRANGRLFTWEVGRINSIYDIARQIAPYSEKAQRLLAR